MVYKWLLHQICGLLLVITFEGLLAHHCTPQQLAFCRKERDEHIMNVTNSSTVEISLIQMPIHLVEIYCSYFNSTIKACYEDLRQHCTEEVQVNFIGYEDAVTYLCSQNYQGFLNAKSCLNEPDTARGMAICADLYKYTLQQIKPNTKDSIAQECSAIHSLQQCHIAMVKQRCDEAAVEWITTFNHKQFQPELYYKKCDAPTTTTTTKTTPASTTTTTTPTPASTITTTTTSSSTSDETTKPPAKQLSEPNDGPKAWLIAVVVVGVLVVTAVIVIVAIICIYRHSSGNTEGQQQLQPHGDIAQIIVNIGPDSYRDQNRHHSSSRHGSSGSVHNSDRSYHGPSSHSHHRYDKYPDDRYAKKDNNRKRKQQEKSISSKDISSEYLEPVRYTSTPSQSVLQPPNMNEIRDNHGRKLNRFPSNEGSEYTQLSHNTGTAPSVVGYTNNTYEELPN